MLVVWLDSLAWRHRLFCVQCTMYRFTTMFSTATFYWWLNLEIDWWENFENIWYKLLPPGDHTFFLSQFLFFFSTFFLFPPLPKIQNPKTRDYWSHPMYNVWCMKYEEDTHTVGIRIADAQFFLHEHFTQKIKGLVNNWIGLNWVGRKNTENPCKIGINEPEPNPIQFNPIESYVVRKWYTEARHEYFCIYTVFLDRGFPFSVLFIEPLAKGSEWSNQSLNPNRNRNRKRNWNHSSNFKSHTQWRINDERSQTSHD